VYNNNNKYREKKKQKEHNKEDIKHNEIIVINELKFSRMNGIIYSVFDKLSSFSDPHLNFWYATSPRTTRVMATPPLSLFSAFNRYTRDVRIKYDTTD